MRIIDSRLESVAFSSRRYTRTLHGLILFATGYIPTFVLYVLLLTLAVRMRVASGVQGSGSGELDWALFNIGWSVIALGFATIVLWRGRRRLWVTMGIAAAVLVSVMVFYRSA